MKKVSAKGTVQESSSKVFTSAEVDTFKRVFDKLSKDGQKMSLQAYVKHVKDLSKNKPDPILKMIVADLENDGEETVNFKQFLEIMEEKVGDLESTSGVQKIFGFLARDPLKQRVGLVDLQRLRTELGVLVSDKDLQRLVNFVTVTFNSRSDFTYEEFEDYVLKKK